MLLKKMKIKKNYLNVLKKSEDITNMTFEEYEIYIDDYTKKSKYPDITNEKYNKYCCSRLRSSWYLFT